MTMPHPDDEFVGNAKSIEALSKIKTQLMDIEYGLRSYILS